jgi:hypothetical protein
MGGHDDLLRSYIKHETSPDGKWWVDVPVGLKLEQEGDASPEQIKEADAVCLTSRPHEFPEVWPENNSRREFVNPEVPEAGVTKRELFRRVREKGYFNGETASILEVKPSKSSFKALGQLIAYRELLEEDYGWEIDEAILLSAERDKIVDEVAQREGIRLVQLKG